MSQSRLEQLFNHWKNEPTIAENIAVWKETPAREAVLAEFPESVNPLLIKALKTDGIYRLYSHQLQSWNVINEGNNAAIVTGTASGKTLCYNLPIINRILISQNTTALYLFPTKALTQDQFDELDQLLQTITRMQQNGKYDIPVAVYDGDTPSSVRSKIRGSARVLFSNPDMVHTGILPHHTLWSNFLHNLNFVVIDEMHIYRGVFGSHIANLIRRLKRIAAFYGAKPQFILTSATIANPKELAENLVEEPVELIIEDGSARGKRHFILYNPPIYNPETGLRKSALSESLRLAQDLFTYRIQTLIFTHSRRMVEIGLRNLRLKVEGRENEIHGYRSGYLPSERRDIEQRLRSGETKAVVATNALELGVDIGGMDAVILVGYPGSIAATQQQLGRAGRKELPSGGILVASSNPLDQYLVKHPEFLFERSPEEALINPNNLLILLQHLRCAAFEMAFYEDEPFGRVPPELVDGLLHVLEESNFLHLSAGRYFWTADQYPAQQVSLRSSSAQRIILIEDTPQGSQTIGEVDSESACWMVHPHAVYLHEGRSYEVQDLDLENGKASLYASDLDYYTEAKRDVRIDCIQEIDHKPVKGGNIHYGEVLVTTQVTGFRKIRWFTQETLADEPLEMPPSQLRTMAYWLSIGDETVAQLRENGFWNSDANNYGPDWDKIRAEIRKRDQYTCRICGIVEKEGHTHHVHHKTPFRTFTNPNLANQPENLMTLCPGCHKKVEIVVRMRSGLVGLEYTFHGLAPLLVMCDSSDLGGSADPQSPLSEGRPTIVLYDQIPAGIGLSHVVFNRHEELVQSAFELISSCPCNDGCPGCVGAAGENGVGGKAETLALLTLLCDHSIGLTDGIII
jgi:DEAD/DEAH box helicase domain-containing protein